MQTVTFLFPRMAERRTSETGCQDIQHSLVSAIRDKYDDTTTTNDDSFCQIFVPKSGPGAQGEILHGYSNLKSFFYVFKFILYSFKITYLDTKTELTNIVSNEFSMNSLTNTL